MSEAKGMTKTMEWINYKISDLFEIQLLAGDNQVNKLLDGKIPLVSAGTINNGICNLRCRSF